MTIIKSKENKHDFEPKKLLHTFEEIVSIDLNVFNSNKFEYHKLNDNKCTTNSCNQLDEIKIV